MDGEGWFERFEYIPFYCLLQLVKGLGVRLGACILSSKFPSSVTSIVNSSPGHSLLSCVPGVLLPGQQLTFPFTFKSPNTGIFSEMWSLHTGPVLGKGRPIFLALKGITFQEDVNAQRRQEIEVCECFYHFSIQENRLVSGLASEKRSILASLDFPPSSLSLSYHLSPYLPLLFYCPLLLTSFSIPVLFPSL